MPKWQVSKPATREPYCRWGSRLISNERTNPRRAAALVPPQAGRGLELAILDVDPPRRTDGGGLSAGGGLVLPQSLR